MKHRMTLLMGWASWNCFRTNISEQVMKEQADVIKTVMDQNNFKMTIDEIKAVIPSHSVMVFRITADKNVSVKNEFDIGEFTWKKDIFIDTAAFQNLLANGAVLVDVRTSDEYNESHLDTAINLPYMDIHEIGQEYLTDKKKDIILYCASGKRCSQAKRSLEYLGYENLYLYKMEEVLI